MASTQGIIRKKNYYIMLGKGIIGILEGNNKSNIII
jgi:hypothetical protein